MVIFDNIQTATLQLHDLRFAWFVIESQMREISTSELRSVGIQCTQHINSDSEGRCNKVDTKMNPVAWLRMIFFIVLCIFFTCIESTLFTSIPSTQDRFSFCNFLCKILTGGCHMNDNGEILLEYSIYPKTGEIQQTGTKEEHSSRQSGEGDFQ